MPSYQAMLLSGTYCQSVVQGSAEMAQMLIDWGIYPDCTTMDVTNVKPRPAPGWTYADDRQPKWRTPQPGPDWTWNDETDSWDAPPEPEPEPDPTPDPEEPETA